MGSRRHAHPGRRAGLNVKTIAAALAVAIAVSAAACGESVTGPVGDVRGTTWRLESLQRAGAPAVTPPPGTFTLRFAEDGRLEVRADCNGCGSTFELAGSSLSVGVLACTRAFCPSAPFDTEYVTLVDEATTVERDGSALVLRGPSGVLRFVS